MTTTANWTPSYDDDGAIIEYEHTIKRDRFEVSGTWTPERGYGALIDHDNDAPFTLPELKELIATLRQFVDEYDN